ncbi:MAG: 3-oxoacyl-ACP synthase III family protein [Leptospirales bacterium]
MSTRNRLSHQVHLSGIGWVRDLPRIPFPGGPGFPDTPEEIYELTGIVTRSRAGGLEADELAERAARDLLRADGTFLDSIDFLLVTTTTPVLTMPSTAALVAGRLFGNRPVPALDVGGSCSGFLVALQTATALIGAGDYRNILIIATEKKSAQICPIHAPETAPLFGDMAAAALISREPSPAVCHRPMVVKAVRTTSKGELASLIRKEVDPCDGHRILRMDGSRVFREAVSILSREIPLFLAGQNLDVTDLELAIFHQANGRLLANLSNRLGIPTEKVPLSISEYGNTSSASLPLTLGQALERTPNPDGPVLLATFGGGVTYGMALIETA